jgi:hypothetical protein
VEPLFPKWANAVPKLLGLGSLGFAALVIGGFWYYATPEFWEVGYQPEQPIAFSHQIHAQQLGMDCRYCHTYVEEATHSNVPSAQTCMQCHTVVDELSGYLRAAVSPDGQTASAHWQNVHLQSLREHYATGEAIPWRRIHKLPDYAHFNHAAHVAAGVSCYSCHGRIDQMPVVYQAESLSMAWCLECHRAPEEHLIDTSQVEVTNLRKVEELLSRPDYAETIGARLAESLQKAPPQTCAACHY